MLPFAWLGVLLSLLIAAGLMVLTTDGPVSLFNVTGLTIVVLGTFGAVLVSYPWREVQRIVRLAVRVFRHPGNRNERDIEPSDDSFCE